MSGDARLLRHLPYRQEQASVATTRLEANNDRQDSHGESDKGFGFVKDETGKEYFFHRSAVYGEGLEDLREGDSVEFDVGEGPKGPRAENVRRTST